MTAKSTLYGLKTISNKILDLAKYSLWRDWEDKAQGRGLIHLEEFQPCLVLGILLPVSTMFLSYFSYLKYPDTLFSPK